MNPNPSLINIDRRIKLATTIKSTMKIKITIEPARIQRFFRLLSWPGAGLGALSYTFGVPILFQYCNVIYLVGAAWLPLGMHAIDRWVRLGRFWGLWELAGVLAMQVLGGDPETAYLSGLAGAGYALGLAWARVRARKAGDVPEGARVQKNRWARMGSSEVWLTATGDASCPGPDLV